MLQTLHSLEAVDSCNEATSSIENNFADFEDSVKTMRGNEKNKGIKILNIVNKILEFTLKERKQRGQGLKILTTNQKFSRLPICLKQLKAGNNSEKYKTKLSNYFIFCTDQKNLQNNSIKVWLALFKTWKQSL